MSDTRRGFSKNLPALGVPSVGGGDAAVAERDVHVSYGPPERFYDEDQRTTRLVKKRYEKWVENGEKVGRWDYVPADHREDDASV